MRHPEHHALYFKLLADVRKQGFDVKVLIVDIACRLRLSAARKFGADSWINKILMTVGMWHVLVGCDAACACLV